MAADNLRLSESLQVRTEARSPRMVASDNRMFLYESRPLHTHK